MFLLGLPFRQKIHRAPQDFWRFTDQGVRTLLESAKFEIEEIVAIDPVPPVSPKAYWARARR